MFIDTWLNSLSFVFQFFNLHIRLYWLILPFRFLLKCVSSVFYGIISTIGFVRASATDFNSVFAFTQPKVDVMCFVGKWSGFWFSSLPLFARQRRGRSTGIIGKRVSEIIAWRVELMPAEWSFENYYLFSRFPPLLITLLSVPILKCFMLSIRSWTFLAKYKVQSTKMDVSWWTYAMCLVFDHACRFSISKKFHRLIRGLTFLHFFYIVKKQNDSVLCLKLLDWSQNIRRFWTSAVNRSSLASFPFQTYNRNNIVFIYKEGENAILKVTQIC